MPEYGNEMFQAEEKLDGTFQSKMQLSDWLLHNLMFMIGTGDLGSKTLST